MHPSAINVSSPHHNSSTGAVWGYHILFCLESLYFKTSCYVECSQVKQQALWSHCSSTSQVLWAVFAGHWSSVIWNHRISVQSSQLKHPKSSRNHHLSSHRSSNSKYCVELLHQVQSDSRQHQVLSESSQIKPSLLKHPKCGVESSQLKPLLLKCPGCGVEFSQIKPSSLIYPKCGVESLQLKPSSLKRWKCGVESSQLKPLSLEHPKCGVKSTQLKSSSLKHPKCGVKSSQLKSSSLKETKCGVEASQLKPGLLGDPKCGVESS